MWRSMQVIAASYLVIALLTLGGKNPISRAAKAGALVMLVLSFTLLNPGKLPTTSTTDTVVEKWEASDCTVTVVKKNGDNLAIKINSNYGLGSTDAYAPQMFQGRIPLLAFPATDSVFFLGMGTGITAGEALDKNDFKNVGKVVVAELSPSVVAASKKYFTGGADGPDLTNGLFQDPRAIVLVEDGRNHLMGTRENYAMINADLFLPYGRGTGDLYSREHFQNVKSRLKPGGVFVQWLPLYQVSENEFGIITRTMLSVFPQVSLWRGNFQAGAEMVALVGHQNMDPLPASTLDVERAKQEAIAGATHLNMQELMLPINSQTILLFYGGNLTLAADLFANYPLNTDDQPVIEFGTPKSLHRTKDQGKAHFVASKFADLVDKIQTRIPPASDPLLASRSSVSRELPLAGSAFHRGWIARATDDEDQWKENWDRFLKHWIKPEAGIEGE
jgi:spermidine synthase